MPTIKDIAREAGVSHGTVSNVLNKTGKVSIEKIRLVEEAAKRLGYVPNSQAQLLRQGGASFVAVILPSLSEETYLDLFSTIQESLTASDFHVSVHTTDDIASREEVVLEKLHLSSIAAVITVSTLSDSCLERYQSFPFPVLFVDRRPISMRTGDGFYSFDYDNIGSDLGLYILRNNWNKIAFFSSPNSHHQASILLSSIRETVSNKSISIYEYSSAYNYALNKSFDIVQSGEIYDVIITPSSVRAEALRSAFHLSHLDSNPRIITLGSFRTFHASNVETYELDYNQLGVQISSDLLHYLQDKAPVPANTILQAKGFPYRFQHVNRLPPETISMITLETPSTDALRKLLPMFEAISGIRVKLVCVPYDDLHTQIEMFSPNFSYDLVRMDVAHFDALGKRTYLPLKQLDITKQNLPKKLIDSAYEYYSCLNDTMYALPFDPSVQILLYRKDLFDDAIIRRAYYERYREQLSVPTTLSQYLQIAEFFTRSFNPDSPTEYGATITNGSASTAACDFLPYLLEKHNGIRNNPSELVLNMPLLREAMEQYQQMGQYACHQQWWADSIRQFYDGHTATTVVFSNYAANIISSSHSSVVGRVGAALVPGGIPLLGGGVIGVSRYSKKLEACKQFINWYYSPDIASLIVRLGGTSPLMDAYNDFRNFSMFPWLSTSKESFKLGVRGMGDAQASGFSTQKYEFAIGTAIRNLCNNVMSSTEAAAMANAMYRHTV